MICQQKKKEKLRPKIMICNVFSIEDKESVVEDLIEKNEYLQQVDDINNKIELVFEKRAAGDSKHFILKCAPEVRALIFKIGKDNVRLRWGQYTVRSRYFATMCYHCSNFGHIKDKCPDASRPPCCSRCAGSHTLRNCSSETKKCINCEKNGRSDVNHAASELCCPIMTAVIGKIRDMTDHGY